MREVVHEAGRDPAEHRLPLLALDVFLQLDEPIGHRVEGVAELAELVARADVDARVELAGGQFLRAALELEDRVDERPSEDEADGDHAEQRDGDRRHELPAKLRGGGVGFARRLFDDDGPAEGRNARGDAEIAAAVGVDVLERDRRVAFVDAREAATSGSALMLVACATSAFLSGSPCATSSPSGATTMA